MKKSQLVLAILLLSVTSTLAQLPNLSLIPYRKGNVWGYATPDKKIVIAPEYEDAAFFYADFAAVKKEGKYGYINPAGKTVIPFNFYVAKPFRYGSMDNVKAGSPEMVLFAPASLRKDGYEICINTKGIRMPKCPAYNENVATSDDGSIETTVKSYALVKANGDLFDKIYDDYQLPGDDKKYYIASRNNKYGVFNNFFEIVIPFDYDRMTKLNNKSGLLLQVVRDGKQGLIKGDGSVALAIENDHLDYMGLPSGQEYLVSSNGGVAHLLDLQFKDLVQGNFSSVEYDKVGGFILTTPDKLKGYYFTASGKQVGALYGNIKAIPGGTFVLATYPSGRSGYINSNSEVFFED